MEATPESFKGLDPSSFARLIPEIIRPGNIAAQETLSLHLERYEFAARYVRPGRLLDIACGVGFGTRLLVDRRQLNDVTAVGVDISVEAISYASERYGSERLQYTVADANYFTDPATGFDTVVSLDTIEELPDPEEFVACLMRLLRPGGILIISVPTTPSVDANPYHLHDFTEESFRRMFEPHDLKEIACFRQLQPFKLIPILKRKKVRARDIRGNLCRFYLFHPCSLVRRVRSTLRYGFTNRYVTIAFQAGDVGA